MEEEMAVIEIRYSFTDQQGGCQVIDVRIDEQSLENLAEPAGPLPVWAGLDVCQCPHCPLDRATHACCPVARALVDIVPRFEDIVSFDQVEVVVVRAGRTISEQTTAQRALSSLLGLLFATSGCPHTLFLKPMANFHLPLATEEETVFRAAGTYLLGQYFRRCRGKDADLELAGLKSLYQNLQRVNVAMANRLRTAFSSDSSVNAIIFLDVFAKTLPFVISERLEDIRYLFAPYLAETFDDLLEEVRAPGGCSSHPGRCLQRQGPSTSGRD
ncbi:MAG: hypothetical protein C0613_03640 [Desulfobulbaceae bacterium]|nr:MAG: hypothetical protein C0613_03640 [Desulfobulbaceae bacterium]